MTIGLISAKNASGHFCTFHAVRPFFASSSAEDIVTVHAIDQPQSTYSTSSTQYLTRPDDLPESANPFVLASARLASHQRERSSSHPAPKLAPPAEVEIPGLNIASNFLRVQTNALLPLPLLIPIIEILALAVIRVLIHLSL